ncbi:MAG: hypothetical protein OEW08_11195, partial [Gammaproteobacteria bacterium]|nr:hypothetical protein [Gammaproteobacteria bacterium]
HEKPAILLLNDTKKELLALRAQSSSSANVTPPVNAPDSEAPALKEALAELQKQNHQLRTQLQGTQIASSTALNKPQPSPFDAGMPSARAISLYVTGGVTLCFAVGFLVGVSWHRGQVSKRLGGFSL